MIGCGYLVVYLFGCFFGNFDGFVVVEVCC